MTTQGKMDRCGRAHRGREIANASAQKSLEAWVMSIAPSVAGAAVLDLGCGTGKLAIPYAQAVGEGGGVLGVDIAPDSIAELEAKAKHAGLTNLAGRVGNLDEIADCLHREADGSKYSAVGIPSHREQDTTALGHGGKGFSKRPPREELKQPLREDMECPSNENAAQRASNTRGQDARDTKFDLIVSSYAIYYATDMPGLLRSLRGRLATGGRLFVCGPGVGTNREMDELARRVAPPSTECPPPLADFISPEQIADVASTYARAETHRLGNAVRFTEADTLLTWWRNHNMHVASADEAVAQAVEEHFATRGEFVLTKNVLGVLFST